MLPAFRDGDRVSVDTGAYVDLMPQPRDVVLAAHSFHMGVWLVKRVEHITPDGGIFVVGDNPGDSTDSRTWGALKPSEYRTARCLTVSHGVAKSKSNRKSK